MPEPAAPRLEKARIGNAVRGGAAYRYLPASVRSYPGPEAIAGLMRDAGRSAVRWRRLAPGLVTLNVGRRR
jgi:ubiquinone/menaquinone biosynthesis C-methylase UbiE